MTEKNTAVEELLEQLRFLKEIGVDALQVELPDEEISEDHEIAHSEFQTYIPGDDEMVYSRIPEKQSEGPSDLSKRKGDILKSMRLSERPSAAPRTEPVSPGDVPFREDKEVARQTQANMEPTAMFEDMAEGLPASDETLKMIRKDIGAECERCRLCEKRTQVVNSVGNPDADLMFIGEAPGADEDEQGEPFVGRAGQLLTKIIEAIDLKREDVFIGNINRCRPPDNRRPLPDEAAVCKPFLLREISVVRPKVIVVLGNTACQNLLDTKVGITRLRGRFMDYFGVKVMPTFHPAYLLRDPRKKREVWEDMKLVREVLNKADDRDIGGAG